MIDDSNNNIWFKGAKWYEADDGTFLRILIWIILSIQQQRQRSVGWSLIINHWMWKYVITAPRPGLHFANVWLHTVLMYNLLITSLLIQTSYISTFLTYLHLFLITCSSQESEKPMLCAERLKCWDGKIVSLNYLFHVGPRYLLCFR